MKRGAKQSDSIIAETISSSPSVQELDVVGIGAGLSGVNLGYRLQTVASKFSYTILEARDVIGGTWSQFKYPGVRSDSDLATFGFAFRPWKEKSYIAEGPLVEKYIKETAAEFGIDKKIRFRHKVVSAEWSSATARWTVTAMDSSDGADVVERKFVCKFLVWCSGYFDYNEPLKAQLKGLERFQGKVLHPQFWPEDYNYDGKKVLIVGSGATAISILPAMVKTAGHVTMLQRSPSYYLNTPMDDLITTCVRAVLPEGIAHRIIRVKNAMVGWLVWTLCRNFPNMAIRTLRKANEKLLPPHIPFEPHFVPSYNPWEQRLCILKDNCLFKALHKGNSTIVTDHIDTFTETGVTLKSGQTIEADVVVTATGLKMQTAGGAKIYVDGKQVDLGNKVMYRGVLASGVPNMAYSLGYAYTSWTLGADVAASLVCRLMNEMSEKKYDYVVVDLPDDVKSNPLFDLSSSYLKIGGGELPRISAERGEFFTDMYRAWFGAHEDSVHFGTLENKPEDVSLETTKLL